MKIVRSTMPAVLALALLHGAPAWGQKTVRNDGNKLLASCQRYMDLVEDRAYPSSAVFSQGYCLGLVFGVMNTMQNLCAPADGVSGVQAVRVVIRYLSDHAAELGERDTQLVGRALSEAYPCG